MAASDTSGVRGRLTSFRGRLILFFVAVVVVPAIAIAIVLFGLISSSANGQRDARLAARLSAIAQLAREQRADAARIAKSAVNDPALASAIRDDDAVAARRAVEDLRSVHDGSRIAITRNDRLLVDVGPADAILSVSSKISDGGRTAATIEVAATNAGAFAALGRRVSDAPVLIRRGPVTLAANPARFADMRVPRDGQESEFRGDTYRAASFQSPGFGGTTLRVSILESTAHVNTDIRNGRLIAIIYFCGFVLLAIIAAVVVSRALQAQVRTFLTAARRIGGGDFSATVPTRGNDEFAQLGAEFNSMASQLQQRQDDLRRERVRLARSLRRLGDAFAANLDRHALLEIVVATAIDILAADGGRARLQSGEGQPFEVVSSTGALGASAETVREIEAEVLTKNLMLARDGPDSNALAYPLRAGRGADDETEQIVGLIVVWRARSAFTENEREMFEYLAAQAAVSVQNVGHHESVERAATTDALTGLSNRRAFDLRLANEVERAKRLDSDVAVVMLDIDDFKAVNDTYGHQQGDEVLRDVAGVVALASRDLDLPGRLGGEELAVILPGTSTNGAHGFAERVRKMIEELEVARIDGGDGPPLRVTASFGVAAARGEHADAQALYAASDAALYEAKRGGKNRVESTV